LRVVSPYWAILQARYRMLLQYRGAALAGAATQLWWGFIKIMVLEVFYLGRADLAPMSFEAAVAYVWLGQAFIAMLPWNLDRDIADMVRGGHVAYEFVRPVDLYTLWYARVLALRISGVTLRCAPIFAFAALLLPFTSMASWALPAPPSLAAALGFLLAMAIAFLLSAALSTLAHVTLLWTLSGEGVSRILPALVIVFSGMVVPLPFFPDWLQPFLRALPFRALCDLPFRIYSGDLGVAQAVPDLLVALAWAAALVVAGRALLARGTRRVVVQGG
jgi:ABC-2 type transport system permease protein